MWKRVALLIMIGICLGSCSLVKSRAGIEVVCQPTAKIFVNGKEAGSTPYRNSYLAPGPTKIKLVTSEGQWEKTVELTNNINTVIDWTINNKPEENGGYILSMERTGDSAQAGLLLSGIPNEMAVAINGEIKGFSPMRLDDMGEGEKQITISYPTYRSLNVFVRAIKGYRLLIEARLPKENILNTPTEVMPTENLSAVTSEIMILPTETGWLRVRSMPDGAAPEVDRVQPGQKFELLDEKDGWYQIGSGWISAKYAEKL